MAWFRQASKWTLLGLGGLVVLGAGVGIGVSTQSKDTTTVVMTDIRTVQHTTTIVRTRVVNHVRTRVVTHKVTTTPAPPPASVGLTDKDFTANNLEIKDDGLGDIGGIVRLTNNGAQSLTATFTITFFQSGAIIGTAEGSADGVAPGQTVTAQLLSQDSMVAGQFRWQFQVDSEF